MRDLFAKKGSRHARYGRMKLDHVAVAALVGWYLMVPPQGDPNDAIQRRSVTAA